MVLFDPIDRMLLRLKTTKADSDLVYFFDLISYGEQLTKLISLFLVSSITEDVDRSRYRHEYLLVRANGIGDFSKTIDEVLSGPSSDLIQSSIRDHECKELTQRLTSGWQFDAIEAIDQCLTIFNITHEKPPIKRSFKLWFHLFTILRNKTKGHGATLIEPSSKCCPLLESAFSKIYDNFTIFKRPCAYLYRNLNGKYRVSYISHPTGDFDFLKKSNSYSYQNGIYFFLDTPTKLNFVYTNSELTDYYFINGNFSNTTFDTLSYLSGEVKQQSSKDYLIPITSLPSSTTEGQLNLDIIGNYFTNIPKPATEYISRPELEKELENVLLDENRFPLVTLVGRGGIGKTSLAINVIRKLSHSPRFDIVVWFSARDIDLLLEGPKQVKTKVLNQKDIARDYCNLISPDLKIADEIEFFSSQLTSNTIGKALYIFDNFETLLNPVDIFEWLNTNIRNPNKILITSRISRNFKADYPIEVRGMSDTECKELIDLIARKFDIKKLLTPKYIDELIHESDGHPYIIKILLGEVAKNKELRNIKRIVAENDKILSALFNRTFHTLSPAAKRLFLTLCSWNSAVPLIAVEAVLIRPENEKMDFEKAIDELHKSSFIELFENENDTFVNIPLAASLYGKTELEVYSGKLQVMEDRKLLMEFGATNQSSFSQGVASRIQKKFMEVSKRINSLEEFCVELPVLEYLASKYNEAWIYIAEIFEEYGDYKNVKYALREYLKNNHSLLSEKANIWLKLADLCRHTNDWEGESHSLSELASIPSIPFSYISESANRINNYLFNHPDSRIDESKKLILNKMIGIMEARMYEANSTDYSRLAWLLLNNGNDEKAKFYASKGLEFDSNDQHCLKLYHKLSRK